MSAEDRSTNHMPRQGIKRFLRFSLIYAAGDALAKGARIVLIPYYLAVLSQREIGELAVVQAVIFLSWTLLAFGMGFAVRRYYYDYENGSKNNPRGDCFVATLWCTRWLIGLPAYVLLLVAGWAFQRWSGATIDQQLIFLAITAGFLKGGLNIVEFWLNIREEPVKYRAFTFSQFLLTTLLVIYFVTFRSLGVMGIVLGELVSYSVFFVISGGLLLRKSKPSVGVVRWREVGSYCAPVLPHTLFMWGLMGADRLVLNEYVDKAQIGVYEVGYLLGSFLSIVVRSMRAAWMPAFFRGAHHSDSQTQFSRTALVYFLLTYTAAMLGLLLAPEIVYLFSMLSDSNYTESVDIMQTVLFGFVAMAVFLAINQPLLYHERTKLLASISGLGLLVNLAFNLILVPQIGIYGAAYSTVLAYVAIAIVTLVVMKRSYGFLWDAKELLSISCVFVIFGMTVWWLPRVPQVWVVPLKIAIFTGFMMTTIFKVEWKSLVQIRIKLRTNWSDRLRDSSRQS